MLNFEYCSPTQYIFGKGTEQEVGAYVARYSEKKKILLVYSNERIRKNGLYDVVTASLRENGISWAEISGVQPNPRISLVESGIELAKKEGVDFVLAVGGGSTIDTGKAIACGSLYEGNVHDFFTGVCEPDESLPVGVILTLSATGSEGSNCAVISLESGEKAGFCVDACRPKFAIMNPELTYTVSTWQTACGSADIMAHVIEPYFTRDGDGQLVDRMIEAVLKTVIEFAPQAITNPTDYNARAQLMWASTMANCGLLGIGRDGDTAPHALGEMLGGKFDKTHGATLSIVIPAWMQYTYRKRIGRYVQYAKNVWDIDITGKTAEEAAEEAIDRTKRFFHMIGAPTSLKEIGVDAQKYAREMADEISEGWDEVPGFFFDLTAEDRYNIYMLAAE